MQQGFHLFNLVKEAMQKNKTSLENVSDERTDGATNRLTDGQTDWQSNLQSRDHATKTHLPAEWLLETLSSNLLHVLRWKNFMKVYRPFDRFTHRIPSIRPSKEGTRLGEFHLDWGERMIKRGSKRPQLKKNRNRKDLFITRNRDEIYWVVASSWE